MAQAATAEARGRSMVRPWRIGLLIDTSDREEVRRAIASLSSVWGGRFMPLLNIKQTVDEIEKSAHWFNVDSLYADSADEDVVTFLRESGWAWRGRGEYGPFGDRDRFHKGVLPLAALPEAVSGLVIPVWDTASSDDLAWSAIWGLPDRLGATLNEAQFVDIPQAFTLRQAETGNVGPVEATATQVRAAVRHYLDSENGIYFIRPEVPKDAVEFWNIRTYGTRLEGLPSNATKDAANAFLSDLHRLSSSGNYGGAPKVRHFVNVWGLEDADPEVASALRAACEREDLVIEQRERRDWNGGLFQGVETPFTQTVRSNFHPNALSIDVSIPTVPLAADHSAFYRGVVAAEIRLVQVAGQDPRFASVLPPFRRFSRILDYPAGIDGIDQFRVDSDCQVLGVDATRDRAPYSFAHNIVVFDLLFDDKTKDVTQSDIGKFQVRAAEKFGGVFSGVFGQPGVREAVLLAAKDREGVTIPHLRRTIEDSRGEWADEFLSRVEPKVYAERELNRLLGAGLLVPVTRVHCSHCRVERWVTADEVAGVMKCEFCQDEFTLALSHSLVPPTWKYKISGHLRPHQIQALLPALAVTSFLRHVRHVEEPPLPCVLGLQVGRDVEVDVAVWIPDYDWLAILGEVKSGNRIDEKDVRNLEGLQKDLAANGVRSLSLFATLKEEYSAEEINVLRERVERSQFVPSGRGGGLPNMPLVLTGPDLSHPPMSSDHPWRWDDDEHKYQGLVGMAITACKRNLGLVSWKSDRNGSIRCEWR